MRVIPEALVHHGFLISYWKYWKTRVALAGALLLCVITAFLIDNKEYYTAGVTGILSATALIGVLRVRLKERRLLRGLAAKRATAATAGANKLDKAKTAVVGATKKITGSATKLTNGTKQRLVATAQSDTLKHATTTVAERAKDVTSGVAGLAKTGLLGALERLTSLSSSKNRPG